MNRIIIKNEDPKPKSTKLSRAGQTVLLALSLSLVAAFAAWLGFVGLCAYDPRAVGLCRHPAGGWIVLIGTLAGVWAWIALMQADRLRRRLRKGLYARRSRPVFGPGLGKNLGQSFKNIGHFLWEGELPASWHQGRQHPALYHNRQGWWVDVAIDGGKRVWVGQQDMYEWIVEVMASKTDLKPGESAIAQRFWEPIIGRPQWDARCKLLEAVGAAIYTTDHPSSRRLIRADVLGIMEDLEESRPLEEQ